MSTASGAGRERAFDLTALDGLRGLAALYVVLHHARIYLWVGLHQYAADGSGIGLGLAYASSLLRFGRCAVLVFFLLSGFVIHLRAARALAAGERVPVRPAGFLRRRARRLMPPLVFALLLTAALDAIGMRADPAMYASFTHGVRTFALNLAFLQTFAVPSFGSNSPLWSLAYEGAFYLAYPVLLAVRVRAGARVAYGSAFAAGAVGWLATLVVWHPAIAIAPYFAVWAAGAVLAEAFALGKTVRQPALLLAAGASIAIWGETAGPVVRGAGARHGLRGRRGAGVRGAGAASVGAAGGGAACQVSSTWRPLLHALRDARADSHIDGGSVWQPFRRIAASRVAGGRRCGCGRGVRVRRGAVCGAAVRRPARGGGRRAGGQTEATASGDARRGRRSSRGGR